MPIGKEKIIPLSSQMQKLILNQDELAAGLIVLREHLRKMRWDDQGGYVGWENGKWNFISTSMAQISSENLSALFKFAGIEPDEIEPKGQCIDCKHSINGREKGYEQPCSSCSRPYHSNFVPTTKVKKKNG